MATHSHHARWPKRHRPRHAPMKVLDGLVGDHVSCFAYHLGCVWVNCCNCLLPLIASKCQRESDDASVSLARVRYSVEFNKASAQLSPSGASIVLTQTRQALPYDTYFLTAQIGPSDTSLETCPVRPTTA